MSRQFLRKTCVYERRERERERERERKQTNKKDNQSVVGCKASLEGTTGWARHENMLDDVQRPTPLRLLFDAGSNDPPNETIVNLTRPSTSFIRCRCIIRWTETCHSAIKSVNVISSYVSLYLMGRSKDRQRRRKRRRLNAVYGSLIPV